MGSLLLGFDAIYKSEDRGLPWIQVSDPAQHQFANINVLNIVSVEWSANTFRVFPNPVSDVFNIKGETNWDRIIVRNAQGQIARTFLNSEQTTLADLANGVYWLEIFERAGMSTPVIISVLKKQTYEFQNLILSLLFIWLHDQYASHSRIGFHL